MCGIAGILRFKNDRAKLKRIKFMLKSLESRGPDNEGIWQSENVIFGHRRLKIIDLSANAHQPMFDEHAVLVFNGAIYNYSELRSELISLGFKFKSHGDTEVILKAYQAWGLDCVAKLKGMFAFALWDKKTQILHLVRDRFGIKPLYYSLKNEEIAFASNPQALLAAGGIDTSISNQALHFHFSLHAVVPAPLTILEGINKVGPAGILSIDQDKKISKQVYWSLDSKEQHGMTDSEWYERVYEALKISVKRRLRTSDVPVGVLLSGGIDSSLLVALLVDQGAGNLQTFSIGFEHDVNEQGDEFEFSDMVAKKFSTEHHKISIKNSEVLPRLPEAVAHMSEPMFGQDAVAFYLLAEKVSEHVKVVQSGQGADEVFGGYFWYQQMLRSETKDEWFKFHHNYVDRNHGEFKQMLGHNFQSKNHTRNWLIEKFANIKADNFLAKVLNLDVTTLIVDDPVKRVDNMTMAFGLEARVPFLDHELVEIAAKMPNHLKFDLEGKGILKSIAKGILPDRVIDRPKAYFPMPALKYVRGDFLGLMREVLLSKKARERGLYKAQYVEKLLARPTKHFTRISGSKLWHLALTEMWLQVNNI